MKRKKLHLATAIFFAMFIMFSFSSNPPNGNTGAPFDGVCNSCHGGSGGGFDGTIDVSGLPGTTVAGDTYSLTYTVEYTMGTPMRAGLQSTIIFDSNNLNAGDMTNAGTGSNITVHTPSGSGPRDYLEHSPAQFFGGNTSVDFTVDWTAPTSPGAVTLWATSVLGNGSGSGGDKVIFEQVTTTVTGSVALEVDITNVVDLACFGADNGSATANATGGVPPYQYLWDNGENSQTASNLDGGNHTVTVTDDAGSTATDVVNIDEPSPITITTTEMDVTCNGDTDGMGIVNASGGTGTLSCSWSTGGNSCTETNLPPGTFFVTVEDANGCQEFVEIIINEPLMIDIAFDSTDETFSGAADGTATADPSGGVAPYIFDWSNGDTGTGMEHTTFGLTEGTYNVTVTDSNGCQEIGAVNIMGGGCALEAEAISGQVSCYGENDGFVSISVANGTAPINYNWSNGANTQGITDLGPGSYSVTITDAANCEFEISNLIITEPSEIVSNTNSVLDTECLTDATGEIILSVGGGSGNLTILWSNGITNDTTIVLDSLNNPIDTIINLPDTLSGLMPGEYSYVLSDVDGCFITDTLEVNNVDLEAPVLSLMEGIVYLDENGFAGPADFSIVDNGSSDNCGIVNIDFNTGPFDCSSIGTYMVDVTATDAAGNASTEPANFIVMDTIPPVIDCSMLQDISTNSCDAITFPMPTATDNCNLVEIVIVEGFESGSVFPSGTTTVTFRAIDDCSNFSECSFNVTVNVDLMLDLTTTDITCPGGTDGSLTTVVTGGIPPYTIFSNPPIADNGNVPAGTYSINVSDSGNCFASQTFTISEPAPIDVTAVSIIGSDWGTGEGEIDIEVSGGTEPYLYNWVDQTNSSIATTEDLTGLEIGIYTVIITDNNGCESGAFSFQIESTSATIDPSFDNNKIVLSPNPASNFIQIEHLDNISEKVEVISIDGKVLKEINRLEATTRVDCSDLESGLYLMRFYAKGEISVKQFLKI